MDLIRSIQMSENSIMELMQMVEDGELTADIVADTIEAIEGEIGIKCDTIADIVTSLDGNIETIKNEIKRLQERLCTMQNQKDYLVTGLMEYLKYKNTPKVKTALHSFSVCKNGGKLPLEITGDVPEAFLKYTPSVDTMAIRNALENGKTLGFAHYGKRGENLRIK